MKQFKVFEYKVIIAFLAINPRTGRAQNIFSWKLYHFYLQVLFRQTFKLVSCRWKTNCVNNGNLLLSRSFLPLSRCYVKEKCAILTRSSFIFVHELYITNLEYNSSSKTAEFGVYRKQWRVRKLTFQ